MRTVDLIHSSTFRLVLSYMVLFASSVLLLLGFIYWSTIAFMANQTDLSINKEVELLSSLYKNNGLSSLVSTVSERSTRYQNESSYYALLTSDRRFLAGNLRAGEDTTRETAGWINLEFNSSRSTEGKLQIRAQSVLLSGGEVLLVGRDTRNLLISQNLIIPALLWGLLIMGVLAITGGVLMSRSVLRHIEKINQTVCEILAGDFSRRITIKGSSDDFDQLARNLNNMLDEIEHLMAGIRHISNNVAHDLRTPLTRLRNQLEALRSKLGDENEYTAHVDDSIQCADQLLSTFSSLLRIARIEAGGQATKLQKVDVALLLNDTKELYEAVAEVKGITITTEIEGPVALLADRDLLFQAIANLLDNAIKYTQRGGQIKLSSYSNKKDVEISVADTGPGIPAEERGKVLQRFYRLESSRTTGGNGLGLSLVAAVIDLHKGELILSNNRPGLIVTLRFNSLLPPPSQQS